MDLIPARAAPQSRWRVRVLRHLLGFDRFGRRMGRRGLATIILLPVATTAAMTLGAVQLMKFATRAAQRRIAAGEFPDLQALGPALTDEAREESALPR